MRHAATGFGEIFWAGVSARESKTNDPV
jgi:hypothetical protein